MSIRTSVNHSVASNIARSVLDDLLPVCGGPRLFWAVQLQLWIGLRANQHQPRKRCFAARGNEEPGEA
jgi:hypothetical protein